MPKIDFKKELKHLYRPSSRKISVVDVPPMQFLMIDGQGDPNTAPAYAAAIETLYSVSYTLKFASKKQLARDYGVMPLEGLWWAEDMASFSVENKDAWLWTAMIMQPDWIDAAMVEALSRFPWVHDDLRFLQMVETITAQADEEGRYTAGSMYRAWKGWSFADKKHPSPWLTFLVLRILGRIDENTD